MSCLVLVNGFLSFLIGTLGAIVGYMIGGDPGASIGSGAIILLAAIAFYKLYKYRKRPALDRLEELAKLLDSGAITQSEYDRKRLKILTDL